jgi:hypothetical protein
MPGMPWQVLTRHDYIWKSMYQMEGTWFVETLSAVFPFASLPLSTLACTAILCSVLRIST